MPRDAYKAIEIDDDITSISVKIPPTDLDKSCYIEKGVELDCQWVEFDDFRYHIQASIKNANVLHISVSLPTPPPETAFSNGLPIGEIEALKEAYGTVVQILDPPRDGFNLTVKLNFSKLPPNEEGRDGLLVKIASVREVVMGAPLRVILKLLASLAVPSSAGVLLPLVHRPNESFFLVPQTDKATVIFPMRFKDSIDTVLAASFLQTDKATVIFPMRFKDSIDTVLAASFLQEFLEARRTAGLHYAPTCLWSPSPPDELKDAPEEALSANAGFVTFVIYPRHVEGKKLDKTVWNLSTFHAYVNYHVKCSEGFMHTRMRCRVESLILALDRAKADENPNVASQSKSFKRLSIEESSRGNSHS